MYRKAIHAGGKSKNLRFLSGFVVKPRCTLRKDECCGVFCAVRRFGKLDVYKRQPVRIHASTLLGYGYAASEFYPELFLYIPAILRNMGVSLCASVRVFEAGINLLAALSCYVLSLIHI